MYSQQRRKVKVVQKDRISYLPDEVLIIILSLLPTKEAVRSSVLSKQWQSLWMSASSFQFVEEDFHSDEEEFIDFVDEILVGHDTPLLGKIQISTRKYDYKRLSSSMRKWIRASLKRNTTDLDIEFGDSTSEDGPDVTCVLREKIFSYNKLVALRLHGDISLRFPKKSSIFPNLKDLLLDKITYKDNNTLPNLLSSCPVLEDLYISRNRWDYIVTLDIKSKSLIGLTVDCEFEDVEDENDYEKFETIIDAPKLEEFDISCFTTRNYKAKDLSSLVVAKLNYYDPDFEPPDIDDTKRLFKFLSAISNVELLTLESNTFKALMRTESWKFPNFRNLTSLEIKFDNLQERTKFPVWKFLIKILKSTPVLETLHFRRELDEFSQESEGIKWDVAPSCFASKLKFVKVDFYYKAIDDMAAMEFFLINTKALKKMVIMCSESEKLLDDISKMRIKKVRIHAKRELVAGGVNLSFSKAAYMKS